MRKGIEPSEITNNVLKPDLDGMYSGIYANLSRRDFLKVVLAGGGAVVLAGCQDILPTIVPSPDSTLTPTASKVAPTATITETATSTNTHEATKTPTTEENVHVEELNPIIWWFIVRDEKGVGTYKRVMEGEYKLVRDANGRIIDAFDADGTQVDAVLFKKGGLYFGWKDVELRNTDPNKIYITVPVMNMGEIVKSNLEIAGINCDITSVKILIGVGEEEFDEYLMPFVTVFHDPDIGDYTTDFIGALMSNDSSSTVYGEENIINIFTRKENLYKQFPVTFNLRFIYSPEEWRQLSSEKKLRVESHARILNAFGSERYRLLKQHIWPPGGEIFAFTPDIQSYLAGTP